MCVFFRPGDNVHGNLIGTDFQDPVISLLFNGLFAAVVGAFLLKRWQRRPKKAKPAGAKQG